MTRPSRPAPRHPFLDWPGPIPFAHRGGASEAPENTAAAFANAVALGYRYLETDVRATADGVAVVFHDEDLRRTCGRDGRVADLTWADLATARVDGSEPISRLDDVLAAFPETRFNIDCKARSAVGPLVDAVRRTGAVDRVCVGSFHTWRIFRLRHGLGRDSCTSTGTMETGALRLIRLTTPARMAAQVPVTHGRFTVVDRRFVDTAHRRRIQVHVWTIDDAAEMRRLLDLGVDGLMTDAPAVLRDVLVARGEWY